MSVFNVVDFGAVGDGVTDDSGAIQAAINAAGYSGTVFFPRSGYPTGAKRYLIKNQLFIDYYANQIGLTLLGEGADSGDSGASQVTVYGQLPTYSGTTASLSSIAGSFVTLTNVVGLTAATKIGDMIAISGTGSHDSAGNLPNNGYFTIASVNVAGQSLTYYGYNPQVNFSSGNPIVPDSANGAIHWTIYKNMISNTTMFTRIKDLTIQGAGGAVGSRIYSTVPVGGGGGNTSLELYNCCLVNGVMGVNCGDIPADYGSTGQYPVGNCENYLFQKVYFNSQTFCGYKNNPGGEQKSEVFQECAFQNQPYGIWLIQGSINTLNLGFESNTGACIMLVNPVDVCNIDGVQAENCARFLVTGVGKHSYGSTAYSCKVSNVRFDTSPTFVTPDFFIVQWIYNGGLELSNCEFSLGTPGQTLQIGLNGFGNVIAGNNGKAAAIISDCGFGNALVTPMCQPMVISAPIYWYSRNNFAENGAGVDFPYPDGLQLLNTASTTTYPSLSGTFTPTTGSAVLATSASQVGVLVPGFWIRLTGTAAGYFQVQSLTATNVTLTTAYPAGFPGSGVATSAQQVALVAPNPEQQVHVVLPVSSYAIANGAVTDLPNNGWSNLELTGGGASAVIHGMESFAVNGMCRTLVNLTGSSFTLMLESTTETTPWNRFHYPPSGSTANTPKTISGFVEVYYSTNLTRWIVKAFS